MLDARSRACAVLLAVSALAVGSFATAVPAGARPEQPYIAVPSARVVSATANSLTIAAHAHHATHYQVYASTKRRAVYYGAINSSHTTAPRSGVSRSQMTVNGLRYTTAPYWFRVVAINGKHRRYSSIYQAGVRPATPTRLTVGQSHSQSYLTWSDSAAGEIVQQASNSSFTSGVKTTHIRQQATEFTPAGLNKGQTYYFRVRADNYGTTSGWSAPVAAARYSDEQSLTVMTFNVLEATGDGEPEGGQRIAPWSQRRVVAARLIRQGGAGVVAIEEGAAWTGHHQRQAYNLAKELGRNWAVAHTEVPPGHRHWYRTGCYILYRKSAFRAVGKGNHWILGPSQTERFAAYQLLEKRGSGAKFLFVAPHLLVGAGRGKDQIRENETNLMIRKATAFARNHGNVPIVYAGDFNSHSASRNITFDGPAIAMRNAHTADTFDVARSVSNARWDSSNLYLRDPPHMGVSIDHIYVSAGVSVDSWGEVIDLHHGRFVGVMASDHNPVEATINIPY